MATAAALAVATPAAIAPNAAAARSASVHRAGAASVGAAQAPGRAGGTPVADRSHRHATVRGHRPRNRHRDHAAGTTITTWFGPGLFGRHTACGQILSRKLVGVANKRLPCGTLVKIGYGGRHLTVPVVDRGPYGHHATWDLTEHAAELLQITETVRIHAKVVGRVANTPQLGAPKGTSAGHGPSEEAAAPSGATGGVAASL